MSWLLVGAKGQLGKSFCQMLQKHNIDFITWTREQGSISVENFVNTYIKASKPEIIINCAAWTDVDGAEVNEPAARRVNRDAVGYLANAAKNIDAKFVQISTDYVFSGSNQDPWSISEIKNPISAYGRTKAEGEDLLLETYSEGSYIFRTAWLFSPYGNNFAKTMTKLALANQDKIRVVDDQVGQPTSAIDLAQQIVRSLENKIEPAIYHATNSGHSTWKSFAEEIFSLVGADPSRILGISSSELNRPAPRPAYSVLSHECWENTGVAPMRDWRESIAEQISEIKASVIKESL